jgi:hypothetical protein
MSVSDAQPLYLLEAEAAWLASFRGETMLEN